MAKVIPIGQPVNDSERLAIGHLRDNLPHTYTVLHNFEIIQSSDIFEIDLAVIAPHCVFVVDVKGTRGSIDVHGGKWYPERRQPYYSPLAKLRQHAKVLKNLISQAHPGKPELRKIHVHASVLMTSEDAKVTDPGGLDGDDVTYLNKSITYFQSKTHIPGRRSDDIRPFVGLIEKTVRGKARPKTAPLSYREWQVEEKLGGDDRYTEYRAKHTFMGERGGRARLRVYRVDPYQAEELRNSERQRISNAFRAVAHMPSHPNILTVREFFATEDEDRLVLITEDFSGQPLRQHIRKPNLELTFDQKFRIIRELLNALDHAHKHEVIHRNLSPDAILVSADGHARLAAFDYARVGKHRTSTIAQDIVDDLDPNYQAPEAFQDPTQASIASDLFAAGLVFFELLTGEHPFENNEQVFDEDAIFPLKASDLRPDLPTRLDDWLQTLCAFDPEDRFLSAAVALGEFEQAIAPEVFQPGGHSADLDEAARPPTTYDLSDLPKDHVLGERFVVRERLGRPGGFAVAYKVFDTLGDMTRVLKLVTRDRHSVLERLRQEYRTLSQIPEHPHVVKVIWADRLPDETPYIVFEHVEGLDVREFLDAEALSLEDAVTIARQAASGLDHLHRHGVYHQDVKPSNLLWTDRGVRLIDFNVATSERDEVATGGGTRRYLPPGLSFTLDPSSTEKVDRDLYALGITFYECVTGRYPFDGPVPTPGKAARDPRSIQGCDDLSAELVALMQKVVAPAGSDRFSSAMEFMEALEAIPTLRSVKERPQVSNERSLPLPAGATSGKPNYNPFVTHLLTLYSQSQHSNAGTRGLDAFGEVTYVPTLLDQRLRPAVLGGEFRLVIISGNAGDGKTAFIQQLEKDAEGENAHVQRGPNGSVFELRGLTFLSNYDGSQDEGATANDEVLVQFLCSFQGTDEESWPSDEVRLIAINEGRLVDFLAHHEERFPRLADIVRDGLGGAGPTNRVAVINLNLRSVVADQGREKTSIFDRLIDRMTEERFWEACKSCDLRDRCYIHHNARTFMDPVAGPKAAERLKTLYTTTHLRGRLHITLRDLRSSLAFMLVGTRDCDAVHELYRAGTREALHEILDGFYFNSWMGGTRGSKDRLVSLLREIDVGEVSNPDLDRTFAFLGPDAREMGRFAFAERGRYDDNLLNKVFEDLPREYYGNVDPEHIRQHRDYTAKLRRRHYFETRDGGWPSMLPYTTVGHFLALTAGAADLGGEVRTLLLAINRGEGLTNPARLGHRLALQVRQVENGTIRSYRLFDGGAFSLARGDAEGNSHYVEQLPQTLLLRYVTQTGYDAELSINLDVYEMLTKLNSGYRPSIEELQGFYLSLAVFKNALASAPYQEVLLTETGQDFYRISRNPEGTLALEQVREEAIR